MMICSVWAILRKYELISFCSNAGSGCPKYPIARGVSALSEKVKLQAVRLGLWNADLELMGLHAVPAKWQTLHRGVFPRPASGILQRPACVCSCCPSSGLSASLL